MPNATVRVWWFASWMAPRLTGAGHASLALRDPRNNADVYITWLGGDMHAQVVQGTWDHSDDLYKFNAADEEIAIPLRDDQHQIGLDAVAICDWWTMRRAGRPDYHLLSKENNCDGTVMRALVAGGGEHFVPCPKTLTYYRGARTVLIWATELKARIERLRSSPLEAAGGVLAEGGEWNRTNRVWSLDQWKRESDAGRFAMRKEQVAAIDRLLEHYQHDQLVLGHDDAAVNRLRTELIQILELAVDHLKKKPTSPRRRAVLCLGRQVYDAIRRLP